VARRAHTSEFFLPLDETEVGRQEFVMDRDEWDETLKLHRKAQIEKLRALNRKDISVNNEHRDEIQRAAQGFSGRITGGSPNLPHAGTTNRKTENMALRNESN
jgi:hypothetical protein